MSASQLQPSSAGRTNKPAMSTRQENDAPLLRVRALVRAERACCCSARPVLLVRIPPSDVRRHRTDLLLCVHHYRANRRSLADLGATVIDASGRVLEQTEDWPVVPA